MAATLPPPRLLPSGDSAITVEFSRNIDDAANRRVLALDRAMTAEPVTGVTETVPTYRSLLVHYDPVLIDFDKLGAKILTLAQRPVPATTKTRRWRIPVVYGGEHGIDLEDVAKTLNTTPDEIVARHVAGDYRVAMIGFTPGWSYLSGLADTLHMPRRQNPRLLTPAGTISIGGVQTGVQCLAGPSGWHLLGQTAVRTYQLHRDPIVATVRCPGAEDAAAGEQNLLARRGLAHRSSLVTLTRSAFAIRTSTPTVGSERPVSIFHTCMRESFARRANSSRLHPRASRSVLSLIPIVVAIVNYRLLQR